MQRFVLDGFVQRVHVQVQNGHQAAFQRGEQRRRADRVLRLDAGQEALSLRVVVGQRGRPAGGAHIRVARQRVVLHTADSQPGRHLTDVGQRADGEPIVRRHRAPHIDFGQLSSERQPVMIDVPAVRQPASPPPPPPPPHLDQP